MLSICNKYKKWDKQINGKIFYVHELDKTIVKISIYPKASYRFNATRVKILVTFFTQIEKKI